jgi:hypothetical protein
MRLLVLSLSALCAACFGATCAVAQTGQSPPTPQTAGPAAGAGPWSADNLILTPQKGQSVQQLWADRYACDAWAKSQSGYDSSRPAGGGLGASSAAQSRNYRSAMIACLQERGYSVRDAGQPAPPPAETPPPEATPREVPDYLVQAFEPAPEFQYRPLTGQIEGGYTVTQGEAGPALRDGWNGGLGFTWTPIAALPLGLRVDGSYSRFGETNRSLQLAAQSTGANGIIFGRENVYGGDTDAQIDLKMGPAVREYFFGGVGWYREQTIIRQVSFQSGTRCFYYCFPGYVPVVSTLEQRTTGWLHSWNAGMGFEFALAPPASFFIEARYLRIGPANNRMEFVPIRFGLRF